MTSFRSFALAAVLAVGAAYFVHPATSSASALHEQAPPPPRPEYVAGSLLVRFAPEAMAPSLAAVPFRRGARAGDAVTGLPGVDDLARQAGATLLERPFVAPADAARARALGVDRWFRYQVAPGDMVALAARFAADPSVEAAMPEWLAWPDAAPDDPYYPSQWGHDNTGQMISFDWDALEHVGPAVGEPGFDANADLAWDTTAGSPDVTIAVIDTGVDLLHEDLACVAGYDFADDDDDPMDDSRSEGHGTLCAGIAAAVTGNGVGVAGVAGGCRVMPLKVADFRGVISFLDITSAIYYAADHGADIISLSISGSYVTHEECDAAIEYAWQAGCLIVASAGNYNAPNLRYPAVNPRVVAAGAASPCGGRKRSSSDVDDLNSDVLPDPNGFTCDGERWWGSNWGVDVQDDGAATDVLGPTILPSTDVTGGDGWESGDYNPVFNGTSCAAPYVAGVCALIKSANPDFTPQQVRDRLCATARDVVNVESGEGWDMYSGYGLVDAQAAVAGGGPAAVDGPVPAAALAQNAPNPFNPRTTITFTLPQDGRVTVTVHDAAGRLVRTLLDGHRSAATHSVVWDGADQAGREAPSGIYFYRVAQGGSQRAGRMALVR